MDERHKFSNQNLRHRLQEEGLRQRKCLNIYQKSFIQIERSLSDTFLQTKISFEAVQPSGRLIKLFYLFEEIRLFQYLATVRERFFVTLKCTGALAAACLLIASFSLISEGSRKEFQIKVVKAGNAEPAPIFSTGTSPDVIWQKDVFIRLEKGFEWRKITLDLQNRLTSYSTHGDNPIWQKYVGFISATAIPVIMQIEKISNRPGVAHTIRDYIAVTNIDGKIRMLAVTDGSTRWEQDLAAKITVSPLFTTDKLLMVACANGKIYGLRTTNGSIHYMVATGKTITSLDPVFDKYNRNRFYATAEDKSMLAMDAATGEIIWEKQSPSAIIDTPLITKSRVITKTSQGQVQAYDKDGQLIWMDSYMPDVELVSVGESLYLASKNIITELRTSDGEALRYWQLPGQLAGDFQVEPEKHRLSARLTGNFLWSETIID